MFVFPTVWEMRTFSIYIALINVKDNLEYYDRLHIDRRFHRWRILRQNEPGSKSPRQVYYPRERII